jgi:hypothetical protein
VLNQIILFPLSLCVKFIFFLLIFSFVQDLFSEVLAEVKIIAENIVEDDVEDAWDTGKGRLGVHGVEEVSKIRDRNEDENNFQESRPQPVFVQLDSSLDPLTGKNVVPPPYARTMQVIDSFSSGRNGLYFPAALSAQEIVDLRFV